MITQKLLILFDMFYAGTQAIASKNRVPTNAPAGAQGGNIAGPVSLISNYEFWLTVCILVFGVVSIIVSCRYISKDGANNPDSIIRIISVNLIVIGTLVTITGGLSDKQIAPAFGLFGTIAGYLLGRNNKSEKSGSDDVSRRSGGE